MPPALQSRDAVVGQLLSVLRRTGYDGASLAELSKATGLGKSSLYHHFPAGKDDMVRAVLEYLARQLRQNVFVPLHAHGEPLSRLNTMLRALDTFYAHGHEPCVLAQLVMGTSRDRFRAELTSIFTEWTQAIAHTLIDAGFSASEARLRAEDAVLRVQGALLVAAGLDDDRVFGRTLSSLAFTLLAVGERPTT